MVCIYTIENAFDNKRKLGLGFQPPDIVPRNRWIEVEPVLCGRPCFVQDPKATKTD